MEKMNITFNGYQFKTIKYALDCANMPMLEATHNSEDEIVITMDDNSLSILISAVHLLLRKSNYEMNSDYSRTLFDIHVECLKCLMGIPNPTSDFRKVLLMFISADRYRRQCVFERRSNGRQSQSFITADIQYTAIRKMLDYSGFQDDYKRWLSIVAAIEHNNGIM